MTENLLVFDVWAPLACFRKSETTTTSLTFPFMPRSAAEGLIGAVLGFTTEEYPKKLASSKIAIGILNPVRKIPFSATYTDTKEIWTRLGIYIKSPKEGAQKPRRKVEFRTKVKMELLRDPCYRIYFDDEETKELLRKKLLNHETIFTPYLGSSNMIANFKYLGRYNYETVKATNPLPVASVVPFFNTMPKIHLEKNVTFALEQNLPIHMTSERVLIGTYNAVYSPSGAELKVVDVEVQKVQIPGEDLYIIFLPTAIPSK
jgi:CRISPR-associated protein Cas5h